MIALDKLRTLGLAIILAWGWKRAAIALIAGGISLGNLLESTGLIEFWANRLD